MTTNEASQPPMHSLFLAPALAMLVVALLGGCGHGGPGRKSGKPDGYVILRVVLSEVREQGVPEPSQSISATLFRGPSNRDTEERSLGCTTDSQLQTGRGNDAPTNGPWSFCGFGGDITVKTASSQLVLNPPVCNASESRADGFVAYPVAKYTAPRGIYFKPGERIEIAVGGGYDFAAAATAVVMVPAPNVAPITLRPRQPAEIHWAPVQGEAMVKVSLSFTDDVTPPHQVGIQCLAKDMGVLSIPARTLDVFPRKQRADPGEAASILATVERRAKKRMVLKNGDVLEVIATAATRSRLPLSE
jgi:hypothetical protein